MHNSCKPLIKLVAVSELLPSLFDSLLLTLLLALENSYSIDHVELSTSLRFFVEQCAHKLATPICVLNMVRRLHGAKLGPVVPSGEAQMYGSPKRPSPKTNIQVTLALS